MRRLLLIALLIVCASRAFAQSSSGYPYPGCQVIASTTGGDSAGHVASLVGCTVGCSLCDISGYNKNAATRYIDLFALTACPSTGTIPLLEIPVTTVSAFGEFGFGEWYNTGLVACVSTTEGTFTATGTNDAYIHIAVTK